MSRFASSLEDVYFPCYEFESHNINVDVMHHVALFLTPVLITQPYLTMTTHFSELDDVISMLMLKSIDYVCLMAQVYTDYGECSDDSYIQDKTLYFSVMSDIGDLGIDCSHCLDLVEPIALLAHVSYYNGDDSTCGARHVDTYHDAEGDTSIHIMMQGVAHRYIS